MKYLIKNPDVFIGTMSILNTDCWTNVLLNIGSCNNSFFDTFFLICKETSKCNNENTWKQVLSNNGYYANSQEFGLTHKYKIIFKSINKANEVLNKPHTIQFSNKIDIPRFLKDFNDDDVLYDCIVTSVNNQYEIESQYISTRGNLSNSVVKLIYTYMDKANTFKIVFYLKSEQAMMFLAKLYIYFL